MREIARFVPSPAAAGRRGPVSRLRPRCRIELPRPHFGRHRHPEPVLGRVPGVGAVRCRRGSSSTTARPQSRNGATPSSGCRRWHEAERFPAWSAAALSQWLFNPRAGWAESGTVVARLASEAGAAGARLDEGRAFANLLEADGHVSQRNTADGDELRADTVLMAAGADARAHAGAVTRDVDDRTAGGWLRRAPPPVARAAPRVGRGASRAPAGMAFPRMADGTLESGTTASGVGVIPDDVRVVSRRKWSASASSLRRNLPQWPMRPCARLSATRSTATYRNDHNPRRRGLVVAARDAGTTLSHQIVGGLIADVVERKANAWAHRSLALARA